MFRILKVSIFGYLILLAILSTFLFVIKYKVQNLNKHLNALNSRIVTEKENYHILKAEYTYLTNPKRIKKLVSENLGLQTLKPDQVIDITEIQPKINKVEVENVSE
ncbi:MAG: hypothetical protein ACHP6I_01360 [Rickettsiales bacterium]